PRSRSVAGSTDGDGVFVFELALDPSTPLGSVPVEIVAGDRAAHRVPFAVAEFRRPVLLASLECPARWSARDGALVVVLSARHAGGAPGGGLEVDLDVRADGGDVVSRRVTLDGEGRREVTLQAGEGLGPRLWLEARFRSPDGQVLEERRCVEIGAAEPRL